MTVKERICSFLASKGITPTAAEKLMGWGKGTITKSSSLSSDKLEEFVLQFPEVSAEWLLCGKGEMLKTTTNIDNRTITTGDQSAAGDGSQVVVNGNHGVGHIVLESVNKLLNMDCLDATHVDRVLALMEKYAKE